MGLEVVLLSPKNVVAPARGGFIPRTKLESRFESFVRGDLGKSHQRKQDVQCPSGVDPSTEKVKSRLRGEEGSSSRSVGAHGRIVFSQASVGGRGIGSRVSSHIGHVAG